MRFVDDRSNSPVGERSLLSADIIRLCAIILVIMGPHTAAHLIYDQPLLGRGWIVGNLYDSLGIIGVPMFFMLSGFLLLRKQETYPKFFKKRIWKVVLPFLAWIFLYYAWQAVLYHRTESLGKWLGLILSGRVYSHLWFMYAVIALYALTPLLRRLVQGAGRFDLRFFMFLWVLLYPVVPYIQFTLNGLGRPDLQLMPLGGMGGGFVHDVIGYVGYYVAGYVIIGAVERAPSRARTRVYWGLLLLGFLSTAVGTHVLSMLSGKNVLHLYIYFSPSVVLTSVSAIVLLTHYGKRYESSLSPGVRGRLHGLADLVLGVYFFHIVFLELFYSGALGFTLNEYFLDPLFGIPFFAVVLFIASAVVCLVIARVPLLKHII